MFIRSERLFLRPGWPEDWPELLARIGDEGVVKNLAKVPWPYTADDARAVLRLARTLGHRRIVAKHFTDNPASGRVLAKLGFKPSGEVRPSYSLARGSEAPAMVHSVEFGASSDCDGDGFSGMRAD